MLLSSQYVIEAVTSTMILIYNMEKFLQAISEELTDIQTDAWMYGQNQFEKENSFRGGQLECQIVTQCPPNDDIRENLFHHLYRHLA